MTAKHIIYGYHSVQTLLLTQPHIVKQVMLNQQRLDERTKTIKSLAEKEGITVTCVKPQAIAEQVPAEVNHQGIIAVLSSQAEYTEKNLMQLVENLKTSVLILALDGVQDPHNFGAILRSAVAFGVHAVIIPKRNAVGITPTVRKVACGAAELVPVVQVTNLRRCLEQLQQKNFWVVGLLGAADTALAEVDCVGNVVLVLGGEGKGLRRLTKECCDYVAKIPISQRIDSLNVSVAAGVALYEVDRQRVKMDGGVGS